MVLDEMVAYKRDEVARRKAAGTAVGGPVGRPGRFREAVAAPGLVVIAEIKAASPSAGVIRRQVDPVDLARALEGAGAGALSVLTDARYFGGSWEALAAVCRATRLPVLCKEIVVDPVQIDDAAAAGAAAVLLMASVLDADRLRAYRDHARRRGLDALIEVHTAEEVAAALAAGADLVGINNRDLRTLEVDLETTVRLRPLIPRGILVVGESGLQTREQVERMERAGVDAVLVGTALMVSPDPAKTLRALRGAP
ncbi:MAG: indole-3-glycerol phosphate synthase TrpC [Armatimonadota bacterium]|nr:indole-3-glycerol phosphate synthase TrpC [Armatimonadota bacterium]MDR7403552.1 indole-3-glycerol phosphate synthase TrpC [Armatimonadota bacterium]